MIIALLIACTLGGLSLGFAIGGIVERFIFNPIQETAMSTESDALKNSLDLGASTADDLSTVITGLQTKVTAVVKERDTLKAQVVDLNATIATLQTEADATNVKNKASTDALAGVAESLPA